MSRPDVCEVEDCGKPVKARGKRGTAYDHIWLCACHEGRVRRHGELLGPSRSTPGGARLKAVEVVCETCRVVFETRRLQGDPMCERCRVLFKSQEHLRGVEEGYRMLRRGARRAEVLAWRDHLERLGYERVRNPRTNQRYLTNRYVMWACGGALNIRWGEALEEAA